MRSKSFLGIALGIALAAAMSERPVEGNERQSEAVENITVTATKLPEELDVIPAMLSTVSGDELRARGARDLREALSLVGGVDVSPASDAGPAGSVPALWGLREFDAFLLVVDGVPSGGAFNPTLRVDGLNLTDSRDPVTESELGDAQFYRMPGRTVLGSIAVDF